MGRIGGVSQIIWLTTKNTFDSDGAFPGLCDKGFGVNHLRGVRVANRDRNWATKTSSAVQSLVCVFIVVPLAEAAVWAVLWAVGGDRGAAVMAGVGAGAFCAVYAFGPTRWLADPDIAGQFGRDHPATARAICFFGVLIGLAVTVDALAQG